MNPQSRDIVRGMVETDSRPCQCCLCGTDLDHEPGGNTYGPFATICRPCVDEAEGS